MKTYFIVLTLSLMFTACQGLQEEALPIKQVSRNIDVMAIDNGDINNLCNGYPSCNPFIEDYGAELQELANQTCLPASSCATCCMSNSLVEVTFYVEPDSSVCPKVLMYSDAADPGL
ncbi:MAG: hypothetical protein IPM82_06635 [Saprospiraceae bacterium]|nr:hypothetical protein [Saprospiraceae bacterium]